MARSLLGFGLVIPLVLGPVFATPAFARDWEPPYVEITEPHEGDTVSETITVNVDASDNVGVTIVQLSVDTRLLGWWDTTEPYSFNLDTTPYSNGTHTLIATAMDAAGNISQDTIAVIIDNENPDITPPKALIVAPDDGSTVSGQVTIRALFSDETILDRVQLYIDGVRRTNEGVWANQYELVYYWRTEQTPNGFHTIEVRAYDGGDNEATDSISVTTYNVDTVPPDATIMYPKDGAMVNGKVLLLAGGFDLFGVVKGEFYIDGILHYIGGFPPHHYVWDSRLEINGPHTIEYKEYDAAGNVGVDTTTVTVENY